MKFNSQLPYILTLDDLFLTPIYLLLIFLIIRHWSKRYTGSPVKRFIYPAVLCKMLGCIFLALIHHFYYGYGDTFSYFTGAHEIWTAFIHNPAVAGEIIFTDAKDYSLEALSYALHSGYPSFATSYYVMFRIAGVVGLFCFGSYLPIALVFSLLSFWGLWMILLVFVERYPHLTKPIAITTLFVPSVIIWTTGIIKEPLCMFGLGLSFYMLNNILHKRHLFRSSILFMLGALLLFYVKDYIFYLFMAGALVWSYKTFIGSIASTVFRLMIKSIIYLGLLILIIYFISGGGGLQSTFDSYFKKAENLQEVMTAINEDYNSGSGYTLPTNDFTGIGLLVSFLLSLNVTLFRPYLWECSNPLMLLSFVESFATMLLVLILLFKRGLVKIYRSLKDPLLLFCLIFSLTMAALVGFVSFNFGALVRYKTPFEPFFYTMLVIILYNKVPFIKNQTVNISSEPQLHPPVPPHLEHQ